MKKQLQAILKHLGIYERVKFSILYDLYWRIVDSKLIEDRKQEVKFFQNTLDGFQRGDIIFDIGANHGQKTDVFLRLGARVVAVDPDPLNQEVLLQSFRKLRFAKNPVVIVNKAIGDHSGKEIMFVDEPGSAKNTLNRKWVDTLRTDSVRFGKTLRFAQKIEVETVTVEELIDVHGRPFYMKIDVEGYEPAVLRGLQSSIPYISFEVNLPEFQSEGLECVQLLQTLAAEGTFNYAADCVRGLDLPAWLPAKEFMAELAACKAPCIEIFWKAPNQPATIQPA